MKLNEFVKYIDHTYLKPIGTNKDIGKLCDEAIAHEFKAVCVNSYYIPYCVKKLQKSGILVAGVTGFPLGAMDTASKSYESMNIVKNGADEIDTVINIGALKDKNYKIVEEDLRAVVEASGNACVKVIIENAYLTDSEKVEACKLVIASGADYVKTSTGFATTGATIEDVVLIAKIVKDKIKIKAAGRIRTLEDALGFIDAGAHRLGTSSGVSLVTEFIESLGK